MPVLFNPNDLFSSAILLGSFPAHLANMTIGKPYNGAIPINCSYKIAEEAAEMTGTDYENNYQEVNAKSMVGKIVRSIGIWFSTNPRPGTRDNVRYVSWALAHGIEFEKNEQGLYILGDKPIEKEMMLGRPTLVTIRLVNDKRLGIQIPRVVGCKKWVNGKRLSPETYVFGIDARLEASNDYERDEGVPF